MQNHSINTNQHQCGFTLVELMIVITIIGILMSIGVPAYQDYTTRAKIVEAISFSAPAKIAVADYYNTNGGFPASITGTTCTSNCNTLFGIETVDTDTLDAITVSNSGIVTLTVDHNLSTEIIENTSDKFILKPTTNTTGQISWTCGGTTDSTLKSKYLPSSCRG